MSLPQRVSIDSVLFITLDSCRYDTFFSSHKLNSIPNLSNVSFLHKAISPSYFTYGSHAAFWMGFTPGVVGSSQPYLNPKLGKLFKMSHVSSHISLSETPFLFSGENIIQGFRAKGYRTIGTGAVEWFNTSTDTGSVLAAPFDRFFFSGNTWSLASQLLWIGQELSITPPNQPVFLFLNIGETHVPYWHEGAPWERWPSPCVPFGGSACSATTSRMRQRLCLEWVDIQIESLLQLFLNSTILICSDHGDCWGEDGLWEHGISHPATLTVPLLLRLRGQPIRGSRLQPHGLVQRLMSLLFTLRSSHMMP